MNGIALPNWSGWVTNVPSPLPIRTLTPSDDGNTQATATSALPSWLKSPVVTPLGEKPVGAPRVGPAVVVEAPRRHSVGGEAGGEAGRRPERPAAGIQVDGEVPAADGGEVGPAVAVEVGDGYRSRVGADRDRLGGR